MSNILIIKHGSLGDISQASGAIQDIFENHKNSAAPPPAPRRSSNDRSSYVAKINRSSSLFARI